MLGSLGPKTQSEVEELCVRTMEEKGVLLGHQLVAEVVRRDGGESGRGAVGGEG